MPVPTETAAAADERVPASASEGAPAQPAETLSSGGEEENGGASSPAGSLSTECQTELENSDAGEKQAAKIFIGGLNWQTTDDTLKDFFETNFGEVAQCNIMRDQVTRKSRGFGFITFSKAETVDKVLKAHEAEPIYIDEKKIDPKIAVPPKKATSRVSPQVHVKRIFVGGLSSDTTDVDMREYFEQFGEVTEVQLMFDRNTNRHRGFGFVSFKDEEPADKVCSIQYHDIRGKRVEVKVAQTKEEMQSRGRNVANRPPAPNYGYPVTSFGPYYHGNYHYDMAMSYVPGPVMYPGPGIKMRGARREFHGSTYYGGGFMEQRAPPMHGYYAAGPGYGSMPVPHMMRGAPHYIDHPQIIHNVDYVADHFQGMALNSRSGGYTNGSHSPPYSQNYEGNAGGFEAGSCGNASSASSNGSGAYSPTHSGSPTGNGPPPTVNGYSQVPAFTGSPPSSYAVSY